MKRLATKSVIHLLVPNTLEPREDVLIRNILYPRLRVVLGVEGEDNAFDFVLRFPEPAFFEIV